MFIAASEDIGNAIRRRCYIAEAAFSRPRSSAIPSAASTWRRLPIYLAHGAQEHTLRRGHRCRAERGRNGPSRTCPTILRDRHRPDRRTTASTRIRTAYPSGWVSQATMPERFGARGCSTVDSERGWEAYRSDTFARDRLDSGENPTSRAEGNRLSTPVGSRVKS